MTFSAFGPNCPNPGVVLDQKLNAALDAVREQLCSQVGAAVQVLSQRDADISEETLAAYVAVTNRLSTIEDITTGGIDLGDLATYVELLQNLFGSNPDSDGDGNLDALQALQALVTSAQNAASAAQTQSAQTATLVGQLVEQINNFNNTMTQQISQLGDRVLVLEQGQTNIQGAITQINQRIDEIINNGGSGASLTLEQVRAVCREEICAFAEAIAGALSDYAARIQGWQNCDISSYLVARPSISLGGSDGSGGSGGSSAPNPEFS